MADCIFCRIIRGELPSSRVDEGPRHLAIMDINPIAPGHLLVLSRAHSATLTEAEPEDVRACVEAARRIAQALLSATGAQGFNLIQNNGACAGQAVAHLHFHLIPRRTADGVRFEWRPKQYPEGEMERMAQRIRALLAPSAP
jgi:histidine triad (HIT) family protein